MKELREKIDTIDTAIIKKIAQRIKIAKQIGKLKAKTNKPLLDKKREAYLAKLYQNVSKTHQLDEKFIISLFKAIIIYSRGVQK